MKDKTLKILQYNIRNQKNTIMTSLLAGERIQEFDVLAIQESWRNSFALTSYNSSNNSFHLAHQKKGNMRMCFYVNKNIDPESWETLHPSNDLCTLRLKVALGKSNITISVHNVYNPSPASHEAVDSASTISEAPGMEVYKQRKTNGGVFRSTAGPISQHACSDR